MNTFELYSLGKRHVANFSGVFPINKIPPILNVGSLIVNTHTHNLAGQHWIAVHVGSHCVDVFDPLGYYYPLILVNFAHSFNRPVHYNRIMYQRPDLPTCGQHCLSWLSSINERNGCCLINNGSTLY